MLWTLLNIQTGISVSVNLFVHQPLDLRILEHAILFGYGVNHVMVVLIP